MKGNWKCGAAAIIAMAVRLSIDAFAVKLMTETAYFAATLVCIM